jgi:hypothetical protein
MGLTGSQIATSDLWRKTFQNMNFFLSRYLAPETYIRLCSHANQLQEGFFQNEFCKYLRNYLSLEYRQIFLKIYFRSCDISIRNFVRQISPQFLMIETNPTGIT